jgi:hypothetical protein
MGATSWHYYTPYQNDPDEALQRLRADVFARGDYVDVTGPLNNVLRNTARRFGQDPDDPAVRSIIESSLQLQRALDSGDTRGLSRSVRSKVRKVRAFQSLALGAPSIHANRWRERERPRSIAELLEWAAECGTHSVLDIEHVAARTRFGVAAPLSHVSRMRIFGIAEPGHEEVEQHWEQVAEGLGIWRARYLVVYRNGQPHEYAFIGCSGD